MFLKKYIPSRTTLRDKSGSTFKTLTQNYLFSSVDVASFFKALLNY